MSHDDRRGLLESSLANLTIGVAQSIIGRRNALRDSYTGEWEQQLRVPISGHATATWGFVDRAVVFAIPLMGAQSQRMVPFDTPHFTRGVEVTKATSLLVVEATITAWTENEFGWICGATVRFGVQAPVDETDYAATVHLSFQGYGCIAEQEEFQT